MYRQSRPEGLEITSPPLSRSQSVSSERPNMSRFPSLLTPPATTSLSPAYIAASAASQIVTADHDIQAYSWFTEEGIAPSGETALVSQASLKLVNSFLDQLLYNFLSAARSTSLGALKPAVLEVLKPTLAKEAIAGADQELSEYIGTDDDEELLAIHNGPEQVGEWDLELAWKQTRLRCMVYSSLGDVEEEDEDMYAEQEQLNVPGIANGRFADNADVVSPAVAIFLTSILEFIGEQTLIVAGQAAYQRLRSRKRDSDRARSLNEIAERVVVEELDTEKVALNATLGRLWRTWRKRLRSSTALSSRPLSRESPFRRHYQTSVASSSRRSSFDAMDGHTNAPEHSRNISLAEVLEEDVAANIPLPVSDNDVEEIEVPGLVYVNELLALESSNDQEQQRPRSMSLPTATTRPHLSIESGRLMMPEAQTEWMPSETRLRSQSLPPQRTKLRVMTEDAGVESTFVTPVQSPNEDPEAGSDSAAKRLNGEEGDELQAETDGKAAAGKDQEAEQIEGGQPESLDGVSRQPNQLGKGHVASIIAGGSALVSAAHAGFLAAAGRRSSSQREEESPIDPARAISKDQDSEKPNVVNTGVAQSHVAVDSPGPQHSRHRKEKPESQNLAEIGVARTSDVSVPATPYGSPPPSALKKPSSGTFLDDGVEGGSPVEDEQEYETFNDEGLSSDENVHLPPTASSDLAKSTGPPEIAGQHTGIQAGRTTPNSNASKSSQVVVSESGVHSLAPLREHAESAGAPSAEAKPFSQNRNHPRSESLQAKEPTVNGRSNARPAMNESPVYPHGRQASYGDRMAEPRHQAVLRSETPPTDRAAVQRVHSPSLSSRDTASLKGRRSESFGRSQQSIHASDSATSPLSRKLKGISSRQHDDLEKQASTSRSSEENRSIRSERYSQTSSRPADKEKNFEKLIESDETIQYTLTPQSMRQMEKETSRRYGQQGEVAEMDDIVSNTGPPAQNTAGQTEVRVLSRTGSTNLSTQPNRSDSYAKQGGQSHTRKYVPISPSMASTSSSPRGARPGAPIARDARVERSSIRDFADFIRSTGPSKEQDDVPIGGSVRGASSATTLTTPQSPGFGSRRNVLLKSPPGSTTNIQQTSSASESPINKPRLRAREAAVRQTNNDLIDFIRQGPPDDGRGTSSLPSNGGATSRATMETGRASPMRAGRGGPAYAAASSSRIQNSLSSSQPQSINSTSTNSQSALLDVNKRGAPDSTRFDDSPHQPQRKQRRIKDPYSVESDSEGDYDVAATPRARGGDESMMDFLRNVPPPDAPSTSSVFDDIPKPKGTQGATKITSSSPSRLNQNVPALPGKAGAGKAGPASKPNSTSTGRVANAPPQITLKSPGGDGPMFSGIGNLGSSSNGVRSPQSSQSPSGRAGAQSNGPALQAPTVSNAPRKNPGAARTARVTNGTSDLADFLKNTGPPAPSASYVPQVEKEAGGFTKMFRRKKSARVA